MRKFILAALMLIGSSALGQKRPIKIAPPMLLARIYNDPHNIAYNPEKAFTLFRKCADENNAEAMNTLGVLYSKGLGVEKNINTAFEWFAKAAERGYAKGYYNKGICYKYGLGADLDFGLAFQCFKRSAEGNLDVGHHAIGYMYYKGLGCAQDYTQAFAHFQKAIRSGNPGAMYMAGLCYRNGYGTVVNQDSARFLLTKASSKGYDPATDELFAKDPENIIESKTSASFSKKTSANNSVQAITKKLKHNLSGGNLAGSYVGVASKYDWSGKHIIDQSPLSVILVRSGSVLTGVWKEADSLKAILQATLTDTSIIFNNSRFQYTDHYSKKRAVNFEFKDATLKLTTTIDSVFLSGKIQLWSMDRKEPEKPILVTLARSNDADRSAFEIEEKRDTVLTKLVTFPNPFVNSIQISFDMTKEQRVSMVLSDITSGTVIYRTREILGKIGSHTENIEIPSARPGIYSLRVQHGNQIKSILVIKAN